jgi:hypothetical protein
MIPAGYLRTTSTSKGIVLGTGAIVTADFGFVEASTLTGAVFVDDNGNGVKDAAETTVFSGTTLTLTGTSATGGAVNLTTQTNASGAYVFSNLPTSPSGFLLVASQPTGYEPVTTSSHTIIIATGGTVAMQDIGYRIIPEESSASPASTDTAERSPSGGMRTISIQLRIAGPAVSNVAETETSTHDSAGNGVTQPIAQEPMDDASVVYTKPITTSEPFTPITIHYRTVRSQGIAGVIPASTVFSTTESIAARTSVLLSFLKTVVETVQERMVIAYGDMILGSLRSAIAWFNAPVVRQMALSPATVRQLSSLYPQAVGIIGGSIAMTDTTPALEMIAKTEQPTTPLLPSESIGAFVPAEPVPAGPSLSVMFASVTASIRELAGWSVHTTISWLMNSPAPTEMALSPAVVRQLVSLSPHVVGFIPNSINLADQAGTPALELIAKTQQPTTPRLPPESIGAFVPSEPVPAGPSFASVVMLNAAMTIDNGLSRVSMIVVNVHDGITGTVDHCMAIAGNGWNLMASKTGRMYEAAGEAGERLLSYSRSLISRDNGDAGTENDTEHAAAPEQEYRTTLTKKNDVAVIASLHVSVLNSLGVPYAKTPVVLFSTPKIAMTDEEGIATFHDVEVGKHRLEIHVTGDQIETTDIIIEPPSGLSIEEKQSVDVLLPVIRVTVEKQQLHGSAPSTIGFMALALVLSLSAGIGIGVYVGTRRRKKNAVTDSR